VTEVLAAYDFSGFKRIVDVGGGRGTLLKAILQTNQAATGVLFDLPRVIADAARLGLGPRCELISGDFFPALPAGGDAYLMKWILRDWDDEACARILTSCRGAIVPEGKLLVIETVVPAPGVPHHSKLDDIEMMVLLGSQERTEEEYAALLARSGFRLARIEWTPTEFGNVIEAELSDAPVRLKSTAAKNHANGEPLDWKLHERRPRLEVFSRPMLALLIFVAIILAGFYFILPVFNVKVPLP
jgi:hypothetical protein